MSGQYNVDSKSLSLAINRCLGVIALGEKAESNSITFDFSKKGLAVEARNGAAAYRTELEAQVVEPTKKRVFVIPELLLSYANANKTLTLSPKDRGLSVKGGKNFSADVSYVGDNDPVDLMRPDQSEDFAKIAPIVRQALSVAGGMKNRTDTTPLGVKLTWDSKRVNVMIGDAYHVVTVDAEVKQKSEGTITTTVANLAKIMDIGEKFANLQENNQLVAWSDTEYFSVVAQAENLFVSTASREKIESDKKKLIAIVPTDRFQAMLSMLTTGVSETSALTMKFGEGKVLASVTNEATNAKASLACKSLKGDVSVSLPIHHLKDCVAMMKEAETKLILYNNLFTMQSTNKHMNVFTAMAAVAG